jgi:tripartite-type tricarboxylate transporter receptor subunit TctC
MGDFRHESFVAAGVFVLASLGASTAAADPVADFYRGKQIEVIVATESGSIYDTWGRVMARYLGRHIPGNPTLITKNMPGAGHIRAAGYEFNAAPKDGTSIITFSHNLPTSFVMGNPGIKFDFSKFQWLGSPDHPGRVCVVRRGAAVQKAADLFDHELLVAGAGASAAISQTPKLLSGLLGMKFKLVEGYKGAPDAMLAVDRSEVEGICTTIDGVEGERPGAMQDGRLKVLFNTERDPIPETHAPSVFEFTKTDEQRQILGFYSSTVEFGIPFAAPPEVPLERLAALRRAFAAVADDPEFRAEVARAKLSSRPVTGQQLAQRMQDLMATPKNLVKKTSDLLGGNPF